MGLTERYFFHMTMNKDGLDGITVFVQVVESGSFTAAAEQLGHSTSFVSKEVTRLEDRLGARLLNRTTRKISLTDVGRLYFERCKQIVIDAEQAEQCVSQLHEAPRGVLKVSAPVSFGLSYLRQELPQFLETYPELNLDIEFSDRMVDVVAEGFDVVLRIGNLKDSNLIIRRINTSRGVIVAAPSYWQRRGRPSHPTELAKHDCISYSYKQTPSYWEFVDLEAKAIGVNVPIRVQCNSAELEAAMAVAGLGVTRLPAFVIEQELAKGLLEIALEDYERPPLGIFAVYPHRLHLSAKVRVFIDFLAERFGD